MTRMRVAVLIALVLSLGACGSARPTAGSPAAASGTAAPLDEATTRPSAAAAATASAAASAATTPPPAASAATTPPPAPRPSAVEPSSTPPPRPVLPAPLKPAGPPPAFEPHGTPDARTRQDGVLIELWVTHERVDPGQWIVGYVRVTNVGSRPVWYHGSIANLPCGNPVLSGGDTAGLFDPGRTWSGVAATFKERFLGYAEAIQSSGARLTWFPVGDARYWRGGITCADVGIEDRLVPGRSFGFQVAGFPTYALRGQPLPRGAVTIRAEFRGLGRGAQPASRLQPVAVFATVQLGGAESPPYPTPPQLVDAALETPGMIEFLQGTTVGEWGNFAAEFWGTPPYPDQRRLDSARGAPDGILELGLHADTGGEVVLDPWTAQSFGYNDGR